MRAQVLLAFALAGCVEAPPGDGWETTAAADPALGLFVSPPVVEFDAARTPIGEAWVSVYAGESGADDVSVGGGAGSSGWIAIGAPDGMPPSLGPGESFDVRIYLTGDMSEWPDDGFWGEVLFRSAAGDASVDVLACYGEC